MDWGFLVREDFADMPRFPSERCDFNTAIPYKEMLLLKAYERFKETGIKRDEFGEFCQKEKNWLEDFALFRIIKKYHNGKAWGEWEKPLRDRNSVNLEKMKSDSHDNIEKEKFFQFLFYRQWFYLREYCNNRGIRIIGDLPIYVSYDSVDVWTNPGLFQLDEEKIPICVSGVPPDYFSETGQLWGNPTYCWDVMINDNFKWWIDRFSHNLRLFDTVRIDHFRGFVGFWEVPASEKTAINGHWVDASANEFFNILLNKFPEVSFIAEDLGIITADVREIMERFGFTGMRILQFAFNDDPNHPYLPHNYIPNCVAYTGTHDNNTIRGWFENETGEREKQMIFRYLGKNSGPDSIAKDMIRIVLFSSADTVIFPMQDVLGLGQESRMNRPSVAYGNWEWRLLPEQITDDCSQSLKEMTLVYGRGQ
jgi:4-alpha-glucanotransferase